MAVTGGRNHRALLVAVGVLASVVSGWVSPAGADGELDVSFGDGGVLSGYFRDAAPNVTAGGVFDVARDRLGRWVAVGGYVTTDGGFDTRHSVVARWLPDGRIDTSSGDGGYATKAGALGAWTPQAVAVLNDGSIAV